MAQQLLISEQYLKDKSIINSNTDYDLLVPVIVIAQDLKIRPLLGSDLYTLILTEAGSTLSAVNKTLLDSYILPTLLWYIAAESPIVLKFRFMNKGIMEKSNENSQQISTDDLKFLENRYSNVAENYGNEMIKYIMANPTLYPTYFTSYGIGKTPSEKSAFNAGGLYLDDYGSNYPQNDMGDFRYRY